MFDWLAWGERSYGDIALVGFPLLIWFLVWAWKRRLRDFARLGTPELLQRLLEGVDRSRQKRRIYLLFWIVALFLAALARPQWGMIETPVVRKGRDIVVVLDTSKSMGAEDVSPNRMAKAKREIDQLMMRFKGDRIGLVGFAGDAHISCPLTIDYAAARLFLSDIGIGSIPLPGTNVARAIEMARRVYIPEQETSRVMILITDGEQTEGEAIEQAREAGKEGIIIYTVGIGSRDGAPIPERDESGQITGHKRSRTNDVVMSQMDETGLRQIAFETGGKFYLATPEAFELDEIYTDIERKRKEKEFSARMTMRYEERYQWFLAAALVLLVLEALMTDRKNRRNRPDAVEEFGL